MLDGCIAQDEATLKQFSVNEVLYFFSRLLSLFFSFISVALLVRAVLSWFMREGQSHLYSFLILITEPLIQPIRRLCSRFGWFSGTPIDFPFLLTVLLVQAVAILLNAVA